MTGWWARNERRVLLYLIALAVVMQTISMVAILVSTLTE